MSTYTNSTIFHSILHYKYKYISKFDLYYTELDSRIYNNSQDESLHTQTRQCYKYKYILKFDSCYTQLDSHDTNCTILLDPFSITRDAKCTRTRHTLRNSTPTIPSSPRNPILARKTVARSAQHPARMQETGR